ncbi:ribonuclease domain-containing protein [Rhodoferax sp. PAMC 29310]|uniref:ribonuclease domain-containing protein n=1 Tax=Rhodoferax sp. PAMC 29310 TaxID=2822760 RepID=UPI001B32A82B|nr:ribonuclease domain-containing protein [Rhodoferax sp. PAMC 29310]
MVGSGRLEAVLAGLLLTAASAALWVQAKGPVSVDSSTTVSVAELPAEGASVYRQIPQGGPFKYDKDGSVFGNRERLLPGQTRGYYREYTVATPGLSHRGARRIVCGGPPRTPDTCFYTADHYDSFRKIVP